MRRARNHKGQFDRVPRGKRAKSSKKRLVRASMRLTIICDHKNVETVLQKITRWIKHEDNRSNK